MKRRLGPVVPIEILDVAPKRLMRRIVEQVPVEAPIVMPLAPLAELASHEQELFARMAVHVAVQQAQVGEPLPGIARHLIEQRSLAVHDLVV